MSECFQHSNVGVLIPTYNRQNMLKCALESVLEQSYETIEIIIIDNGSTDGTAEYMASISDPRVQYVVNGQNLGLIGSINRGIDLFSAGVRWCTVLCDDDFLHRDFVQAMVNFTLEHKVMDVIHSHNHLVDDVGNMIRETWLPPVRETGVDYIKNRARLQRETFLTGVFFSRDAFRAIGGYPQFTTGTATDDAFIFALSRNNELLFNRHAVACIRVHAAAESHVPLTALKHIQSLRDFEGYIGKTFLGSESERERLSYYLKRYVRHLNSHLWLRDFRVIQADDVVGNATFLKELCETVEVKRSAYSLQVKLAVYFWRKLRLPIERNRFYQQFWDSLTTLKFNYYRLIG